MTQFWLMSCERKSAGEVSDLEKYENISINIPFSLPSSCLNRDMVLEKGKDNGYPATYKIAEEKDEKSPFHD